MFSTLAAGSMAYADCAMIDRLEAAAEDRIAMAIDYRDAEGRATGRHTNTPTCGPGKAARLRSATSSSAMPRASHGFIAGPSTAAAVAVAAPTRRRARR